MSTGDPIWTQTPADHVTEREEGPWRDCLFASALEWLRAGLNDRTIPTTVEQKEALRAAVGLPDDHPGATLRQGILAIDKCFGSVTGWEITKDWPAVQDHLTRAGTVAVIIGRMGALSSYWRRFCPTFVGIHAVALYGHAATSPIWCDPLAPAGTYRGEPIPIGMLEAYFRGAADDAGALLADVGGLKRLTMAFMFALSRWPVAAGVSFYDAPHGKKIGAFSKATTITTLGPPLDYSTDASPGINFGWRAAMVATGALTGHTDWKVVYVRRADLGAQILTSDEWDAFVRQVISNPNSYKSSPDTTPFDQAYVNAAVTKATAALTAQLAQAEAAKQAIIAAWQAWLAGAPKE